MGTAQTILVLGPVYRAILNIPAVALENAMAWKVYRAVVLGLATDGIKETAGVGIFTTVLSEIDNTDDIVLKEYGVNMKGE